MPDVCLASDDIAGSVDNWQLIDDMTANDHMCITFSFRNERGKPVVNVRSLPRWNVNKIDQEKFMVVTQDGQQTIYKAVGEGGTEVEALVKAVIRFFRRMCEVSITRRQEQ